MTHYLLLRDGDRFKGFRDDGGYRSTKVFDVNGADAARAAVRFFGIVTYIQDYFFNNPHGSHMYNVCDDPDDPYLGIDDGQLPPLA